MEEPEEYLREAMEESDGDKGDDERGGVARMTTRELG